MATKRLTPKLFDHSVDAPEEGVGKVPRAAHHLGLQAQPLLLGEIKLACHDRTYGPREFRPEILEARPMNVPLVEIAQPAALKRSPRASERACNR